MVCFMVVRICPFEVCLLSVSQSASQPRLSYAEMAEDYPRYPDIHDLDLTLLNPRMIVVTFSFL